MYVVHPHLGATSTNSSLLYYLWSSFLQAHSIQVLLCKRHEICTHSAISSFFDLGYSTKPSHILLQLLALVLQASHGMHKALTTLDHIDPTLALSTLASPSLPPFLTLLSYLFIHYKIGLNMGKPMGRHPIPIT